VPQEVLGLKHLKLLRPPEQRTRIAFCSTIASQATGEVRDAG
jgi:hypothetical protein